MDIDRVDPFDSRIVIMVPLQKSLVFLELAYALQEALYLACNGTKTREDFPVWVYQVEELEQLWKAERGSESGTAAAGGVGMAAGGGQTTVYIIYGAECFRPEQCPPKYIVYQFEQLWAKIGTVQHGVLESFFTILKGAHCVWEYSKANLGFYRNYGFTLSGGNTLPPVYHVPLGYVSRLEYGEVGMAQGGGTDRTAESGTDGTVESGTESVLSAFIGNASGPRREKILPQLQLQLGQGLTIYNNNIWNNNDPRIGITTRIKADTIAALDIGLVVYYYPPVVSSFDLYRIITYLANRVLVVSEYSMDVEYNQVFSPYVVFAESFQLAEKVDYFKKHPTERKEIVERAYQWVVSEFDYPSKIPVDSLV